MIEIQAVGGLGNQMFQYSFMRYLKKENPDCFLNVYDYQRCEYHNGFELASIFKNIDLDVKTNKPDGLINNGLLARFLRRFFEVNIFGSKEVCEVEDVTFVEQKCFERDLFFIGSWQDVRYVNAVKQEILETFQFPELDKKNFELIKSLDGQNTVSVHVRRGDYQFYPNFFSICNEEYYFSAYKKIQELVNNPVFVVFSDDIQWCKDSLSYLNPILVNWNSGKDSYRDMQIMTLCKHNIIANSTFSWWGGYLNRNNDKIVICPRLWRKDRQSNPLLDSEWIGI